MLCSLNYLFNSFPCSDFKCEAKRSSTTEMIVKSTSEIMLLMLHFFSNVKVNRMKPYVAPMLKQSMNPNATSNRIVPTADIKYMVFRPKVRMYLAANRVDTKYVYYHKFQTRKRSTRQTLDTTNTRHDKPQTLLIKYKPNPRHNKHYLYLTLRYV